MAEDVDEVAVPVDGHAGGSEARAVQGEVVRRGRGHSAARVRGGRRADGRGHTSALERWTRKIA